MSRRPTTAGGTLKRSGFRDTTFSDQYTDGVKIPKKHHKKQKPKTAKKNAARIARLYG